MRGEHASSFSMIDTVNRVWRSVIDASCERHYLPPISCFEADRAGRHRDGLSWKRRKCALSPSTLKMGRGMLPLLFRPPVRVDISVIPRKVSSATTSTLFYAERCKRSRLAWGFALAAKMPISALKSRTFNIYRRRSPYRDKLTEIIIVEVPESPFRFLVFARAVRD